MKTMNLIFRCMSYEVSQAPPAATAIVRDNRDDLQLTALISIITQGAITNAKYARLVAGLKEDIGRSPTLPFEDIKSMWPDLKLSITSASVEAMQKDWMESATRMLFYICMWFYHKLHGQG